MLRLVTAVVLLTVGSWSVVTGQAQAETTEFEIDDPQIPAPAGLARADGEDFYWTVDEGSDPEAFAVSDQGELLGSVGFRADVVDLEAVASTPEGLYLADIGDDEQQRDLLTVYRLLEPDLGGTSLYNAWDLFYDDGEPRDAEALLVTGGGDLRIIDRSDDPGIWAPDGPLTATGENTLERLADAPAGVSDATVLDDGRFALRTAAGVSVLDPDSLQEVASATIETDDQSSSITETLDGEGLLLGSKVAAAPVTRIAVPEGLDDPGQPTGSPSDPSDPTTDDPGTGQPPVDEPQAQQGSGLLTGVAPWIFGVLLLLGLLAVAVAVRRSRSHDSDSDSEDHDDESEDDRSEWWSGGGPVRAEGSGPGSTNGRHEIVGGTPGGAAPGGGTTAGGTTSGGTTAGGTPAAGTGGVGLLATPSRRVTYTEDDVAGPQADATPRRALLDPAGPAREDTVRPDEPPEQSSDQQAREQQEREQQEREQQEREKRARQRRARARRARAAELKAAEAAAAAASTDEGAQDHTGEQPGSQPTAAPVEQAPPLPTAVRVEDVHVRYRVYASGKALGDGGRKLLRPTPRGIREVHALQGVSFTARQGESIGVIGSNGSGKSTLMRTITGLTPPSEGAVWASARPNLLGVGAALLPALSGERNIVLGGLALGLTKAEIAELRDEIVDFAELSEFIDLPMRTYSSGMQQRLKFAIASAKQHEILIVDEALAVGDKRFRDRSEERIRTIREAAGTIFLVSHSMASIRDTCTRAIWLEKGTLMDDGEPAAVIKAYEKHKK